MEENRDHIQKVDAYMLANQRFFPPESIAIVRDKLIRMDESRFWMVPSLDMKDPTTMLIISIFLGSLGIDRFMLGDTGMGILKLLTAGLCGVLTIVDWFSIQGKAREMNFNKLMQL